MSEPIIATPTTPNVTGSIQTADGFTIESNFETPDELTAALGDPAPPIEAPPAAEPEKKRSNRRHDPRLAVETAVSKQREAERLATEAAERTAALEAEIAELKKPKPAPVAAPPPAPAPPPVAAAPAPDVTQADYKRYLGMPDAPKPNDFAGENGWQEFQFAVSHFIAQKMFTESMQRVAAQTAEQQTHAQFTQRLADAKTRIPDFETRFNPQTPIDTRVFPFIQRLENGPDVMLYLSEHQDIAQRLTTLHPVDQIGQIGEIAGTLKAQNAAAVPAASARPAISQAKPVVKRTTGAPPAATDEPPDDNATEAEHEAYWGPRRRDLRQHRRHR